MPLLSLCVPTFNRQQHLDGLVACLAACLACRPDAIEVCISDNASTDGTWPILQKFARGRAQVKIHRQDTNVGASRNVMDVMRMSSGSHILVMGDDDGIDPVAFPQLLERLQRAGANEWLLAHVVVGHAGFQLKKTHPVGNKVLSARRSRRLILRIGTGNLGFIGVHVIPGRVRESYLAGAAGEPEPYRGWPHMLLFYQFLCDGGCIGAVELAPVIQSRDGAPAQFWAASEFIFLELRKALMCGYAPAWGGQARMFLAALFLREILSARIAGFLLSSKLKDPAAFRGKTLARYCDALLELPAALRPLGAVHLLSILVLMVLPARLLWALLPERVRSVMRKIHGREEELPKHMDGSRRLI